MSAPRTNIEKDVRRHRGPLIGIGVVVVFALGQLIWMAMRTADEATPAEPGVDGPHATASPATGAKDRGSLPAANGASPP